MCIRYTLVRQVWFSWHYLWRIDMSKPLGSPEAWYSEQVMGMVPKGKFNLSDVIRIKTKLTN